MLNNLIALSSLASSFRVSFITPALASNLRARVKASSTNPREDSALTGEESVGETVNGAREP